MATNSKIEWTEHTANLWHGCTKVHAGCDNCYAEALTKRWGRDIWGPDKPRLLINSFWEDLHRQQREAEKANRMDRVFVGSMMDIFEKPMDLIDSKGNSMGASTSTVRTVLFESIHAGKYNNLIFLFLTKRPSNINKYILLEWQERPPFNVMFGCSPCDQATFDTLVPQLLKVNGKKFLSIEPLLGYINIFHRGVPIDGIDWIIVGGESGSKARPMETKWAEFIRDDCFFLKIPFFFKQYGEWRDGERLGRKNAGRLLNGVEHNAFPWELFNTADFVNLRNS